MKQYTQTQLQIILDKHKLWLENDENGERADLRCVNLNITDLMGVDLTNSYLSNTELKNANLRGANLTYANLRSANLICADLRGSNLIGADLIGADLRGADLQEASLPSRYIQISQIGSSKRTTIYNLDDDIIFCGCFKGTLKEFEKRVKETHKSEENKQYLNEYLGFVKYIKFLIKN